MSRLKDETIRRLLVEAFFANPIVKNWFPQHQYRIETLEFLDNDFHVSYIQLSMGREELSSNLDVFPPNVKNLLSQLYKEVKPLFGVNEPSEARLFKHPQNTLNHDSAHILFEFCGYVNERKRNPMGSDEQDFWEHIENGRKHFRSNT